MMEAGCQCTMQNRNNVSYAGAGVRFCAYKIDQLILLMVIAILAGVFGILGLFGLDKILEYKLLFHFTVSAIIYFIVKKIYFVAFKIYAKTGYTITAETEILLPPEL